MSKHTPGDWIAEQGDINDNPRRWTVLAVDEQGKRWFVATIENGRPGDTLKTEAANARLVAAAPALLAACREALWATKGKEYDPERFDRAAEMCRTSIAKAEAKAKGRSR